MEIYRKLQNSIFVFGMRATTLLLLLSGTMSTSAGQVMPLPAFDHTFSSSSLSRGYWFEAPIDFMITGLKVPDEIGNGHQNVEVVRFDNETPPPNYSQTTNDFVSLARFTDEPADQILSVDIPVFAGDVIGIMGTTGTSTMHNSYGVQGNFTSEIFGLPVNLTRMGMQYNLYTDAAHDLWQSPGGNIARVEMYYIPEPATVCLLGLGGLSLLRRKRK